MWGIAPKRRASVGNCVWFRGGTRAKARGRAMTAESSKGRIECIPATTTSSIVVNWHVRMALRQRARSPDRTVTPPSGFLSETATYFEEVYALKKTEELLYNNKNMRKTTFTVEVVYEC